MAGIVNAEAPAVVRSTVDPARARGATAQDVAVLEARLARGDRGGVYLELYRMTGDDLWLVHAQISTYTGVFGGTALVGNYNVSLDRLCREIAESTVNLVAQQVAGSDNGRAVDDTLRMRSDRGASASKGELREHGLSGLSTFLSAGTLHGAQANLSGAHYGKRPSEFSASNVYRTERSHDGRFVTVIDGRTSKVEAFWDRQASALGGYYEQTPDVPLTRSELQWHERVALWEFLQANQDDEQAFDADLWHPHRPGATPNPNLPAFFGDEAAINRRMYRNPIDGRWYNESLREPIHDPGALQRLEKLRGRALTYRQSRGLPPEPTLPRRYQAAGLWR